MHTFRQAPVWATPVTNSHRKEKIAQVSCATRKAVQPHNEIFFSSVYFEQFLPESKVSFSEVVCLYCLPNKLLSLMWLHYQNLSEISNKDSVPLKLFKLCYFTIFLLISIRSMASVCKSLLRVSLLINSYVNSICSENNATPWGSPPLLCPFQLSLTNCLSPLKRVLLQKPIFPHPVKIFSSVYGTRSFIPVLTQARQWTLSWAILNLIIFKFNSSY
jgi:hypothetical protein